MINWSMPGYIKFFIVALFATAVFGSLLNDRDLLVVSAICSGMFSAACFILDGVEEMLSQLVRPREHK